MTPSLSALRPWLAALALVLLVGACKQGQPVSNTRFAALGGLVDLSIIGVNPQTAQQAAQSLEADFTFLTRNGHDWIGPEIEETESALRHTGGADA